jgi:peptidoglycan/LPS O-acetylase OafA/YrhL
MSFARTAALGEFQRERWRLQALAPTPRAPARAAAPYRGDIEGLRALAVLPVVLFHFGFKSMSGGFTGVDMFFVISGFVITSGLVRDISMGQFSLSSFYMRRFNRIAPAMIATCSITMAVAWAVMLPPDFQAFGRSLVAALFSLSNFYFWKTSGYFAPESQTQPLLHFWSLAVEEQFYLLMPLAMVLVGRWLGQRWLLAIVPVLVGSLAIGVAAVYLAPTAGFYLLPARAWELMIGSLVAVFVLRQKDSAVSPLLRTIAGVAGLVLIAAALFLLEESDPFPGWNALLPCVGTALVIWSGSAGNGAPAKISALLCWAPLRFIGAISYSLYLVHWPIAAFANYLLVRAPTTTESCGMMLLSLVLAILLWKYVEQVFRHGNTPDGRIGMVISALGAPLLIAAGSSVAANAGVPSRFPEYAAHSIAAQDEWGGERCFNETLSSPINWDVAACTRTHGTRHRILLWGDSFAAHYVPGLLRSAKALNSDLLEYTFAGCPPILAFNSLSRVGCAPSNAAVPALVKREKVDLVVISARWSEVPRRTLLSLHETVERLQRQGVKVVVIGQSPEFAADVQRIDYLSGQSKAAIGRWQVSFDPKLNALLAAEAGTAEFIDPMARLCDGANCTYREGATWLFGDYGHYSAAGSLRAVQQYFPVASAAAGS